MPSIGGIRGDVLVRGRVKNCEVFAVLFSLTRVGGMAMTLDTSEGCSMPYLPGCVHPVDDGGDSKFFIVRSTFVVVHRIPMESCSDQLFISRESVGSFQ